MASLFLTSDAAMEILPTQPTDRPVTLIRSAAVKQYFGGICDMTLWRWIQYREFPRPIKIAGRNYWNPSEIEAWRDAESY